MTSPSPDPAHILISKVHAQLAIASAVEQMLDGCSPLVVDLGLRMMAANYCAVEAMMAKQIERLR